MGCADPTNWVTVARQTRWAKVKGLVQYCRFLAVLTGCLISLGQGPVPPVERQADGIRVAVGGGFLNIQPKTDSIVRVVFSPDRNPRVDDLVVVGPGNSLGARGGSPPTVPKWDVKTTPQTAILSTAKLIVTVSLADGKIRFADPAGHLILEEAAGAHTVEAATIQKEATHHVQQRWRANADESLYGLGQRQEGKLDIKGYDLDLWHATPSSGFRSWSRAAATGSSGTTRRSRSSATSARSSRCPV